MREETIFLKSMIVSVCKICLRTERRTQPANRQIVEFHAEMTNNPVTIPTYFCLECDYLLKKTYKFKEKCEKASEILTSWQNGAICQPFDNIYKLLPPSSIGLWIENDKNLYCHVTHEELITKQEEVSVDDDPLQETLTDSHPLEVVESTDNISSISNKVENVPQTDIITEDIDEYDNVEYLEDEDGCLYVPELTNIKKENLNIGKENLNNKKNNLSIEKKNLIIEKKNLIIEKKNLKKSVVDSPFMKRFRSVRKTYLIEKAIERDTRYLGVFDVKYLPTMELKLEEFECRKTYESYVTAEHKCEICYNIFKSKKMLDYHNNTFHNENNTAGRQKCPICCMWVRHLRKTHYGTHMYVYKCKLCPLVTHYRGSMENHYNLHMGTKYRCNLCSNVYKSASAYISHKSSHLPQGDGAVCYICTTCGRRFNTERGLFVHCNTSVSCEKNRERAELSTEEAVRCDECNVTFASIQGYRKHNQQLHKIRHRTRQGMHCQSCDIKFYRRLEYHKHLAEIHNEIRVNTTPKERTSKRDKKFHIKPERQKRLQPYIPPKYTCRLCNTKGEGLGWLHRHFKKEHPNDSKEAVYADLKTHLCEQCGAGFTSDYQLRYHLIKHEQLQPFACDVCPKKFRSLIQARIHRRKTHQDWE